MAPGPSELEQMALKSSTFVLTPRAECRQGRARVARGGRGHGQEVALGASELQAETKQWA